MHLGIILDGNRRFAKKMMAKPWEGHNEGAKKVEQLLDWIKELGIKEITLYCFSLENFKRSNEEVNFLMNLFRKEFEKLGNDERIKKDKVKIRFAGKKELLDKDLQRIMRELEKKTENNSGCIMNFALAYGGRQEIIESVKKMAKNNLELTEENLAKNLWIPEDIDLIIRTGGEKRTSNFLPWQSSYSEWVFMDKMWPEITKEDLKKAIFDFNNRERRFGK